ncbi:ARMT1-like domain-containing protein, partial [Alteromonas abrolhosensis]|uniref:ARMT1-like domain-containing protein n=1 Tax=Alteromonas abrolhosensis TaxID=1892904 RepID=UPI003BAA39A8
MSQSLDIRKLLKSVVAYKASDLHLVSRSEPQIRIDGRLVALNLPTLDGKMIEDMAYALLTEKQKKGREFCRSLYIVKDVKEILQQEFGVFDFNEFKKHLEKANTILYLGDNAGESVFD